MFKLTTVAVLAALSALTSATNLVQRDIWDPKILTPTAGSVLLVGTNFTVTWDTTNPPAQVSDPTGMLVLVINGSIQTEGPGSLNEPLAKGFPLTDGEVQIVVPPVQTDANIYQFNLFGDSNNRSPVFTIMD